MRTRAVVVATLVLLAGASSALAAARAPHVAQSAQSTHAPAESADALAAQNQTEVQLENLTIARLNLTNASIGFARINETVLVGNATNATDRLGTATATNLTIVNGTLYNVTLRNVTLRNETVVNALFGNETPEGPNATLQNATLAGVHVPSLVVETGRIQSAEVNSISAQISPTVAPAGQTEGEPAIEVGNLTVGRAVLDRLAADEVGVENASIGLITGGVGGDDAGNETGETTTAGETTTTTGNESAALAAPQR